MSKKKISQTDTSLVEEGTPAAETLHPGTRPAGGTPDSYDPTRSELMKQIVAAAGGIQKGDLSKFLASLEQIGHEADKLPSGASKDSNEASVRGKAGLGAKGSMKEDVQTLFSTLDEEVSEDFIDKATSIFEDALETRMIVIRTGLEEEFETATEAAYNALSEELTAKVDEYLSYVVENWLKTNELQIERSLRGEVLESFVVGLKDLFKEHYIDVPEDKVDVMAQLSDKVTDLETKLNESIQANINLNKQLAESKRAEVIADLTEGLAMSQAEKLKELAESLDFDGNVDSFRTRLTTIKEDVFTDKKGRAGTQLVVEEVAVDANGNAIVAVETPTPASTNAAVNRYAEAIGRTVKKF